LIQAILERLMEDGTPFRIAGGAAQLADVKDTPTAMPAVYVFTSDERSAPSDRVGGAILQRTTATIGVVMVTQNLSKSNNAAATGDIEALKTFCRRKLIGFDAGQQIDPLEHLAGELQQALSGTVWFEDAFTTAYYLQEDE